MRRPQPFAVLAVLAAALVVAAACGSPPSPQVVGTSTPARFDGGVALDASLAPSRAADAAPADVAAEANATADDEIDDAGAPCPSDMVALPAPDDGPEDAGEGALFCMDRYEAPNLPGAMPLAFQTAMDGEAWCAARARRLCREDEWMRACRGPSRRPYPYGSSYEASRCNDNKQWKPVEWDKLARYPRDAAVAEAERLYQADPSGTREACASEDGVFDLTGNVAEWVTRSYPSRTSFPHVIKGCFWSGCFHTPEVSCSFKNPAHPGTFRSYEVGFRCCKGAADGGTVGP